MGWCLITKFKESLIGHHVISTNGELGGYGGGLTRKKWLINHEKEVNLKNTSGMREPPKKSAY